MPMSHRGVHYLSQKTTTAFETARHTVARFINARDDREVIFTRGATEAINLVANSYGHSQFQRGDEVILSELEHHSNIVPWQLLAGQIGIVIKVIPINDAGELDLDAYAALLGPRTKLVAVAHISNALGTINPVADIIRMAHDKGVPVMLDGCQGITHRGVDVQALDVDFYAFSGHKIYGPNGVGVLYGKYALLDKMPPWQGGGDMIASVSFQGTTYKAPPHRFEAGTPAIAEVIALGAALDYVSGVGLDAIAHHEAGLLAYAHRLLGDIPGLRLIGTAKEKAGILSFVMDGVHPHDIGTIVDEAGVAIRVGHHCAQPLMDRMCVAATARASFGMYNTNGEVEALAKSLVMVKEIFG